MSETSASDRARRSDGERTHTAILDAAVRIASVEGIGGVTIGRLAREVGVSKSGLYAHFGSKRGLQLEIVEAARDIFQREVVEPTLAAPEGRARLEQLCESYLSYVERRVFPGGCLFAGMLAEFDAQGGTLHHEALADQREWIALVEGTIGEGQTRGEFHRDTDAALLAFELTAALANANYYSVLFDEAAVIDRARKAVRAAIARASDPGQITAAADPKGL